MCFKSESSYFDFTKCISKYTVVMNHIITNEIDEYQIMVQFVIIMVLFSYQCMKIHYYSRRQIPFNNNINIRFQILFFTMTLVLIIQLTYSIIGYRIDYPTLWQVENKKVENNQLDKEQVELNYCDPIFKTNNSEKYCHVRFQINGLLTDVNMYLTCLAIQMITFWKNQISPQMFITIYQVIFNQSVTRKFKYIYLGFIIIDLIMLACQIFSWSLEYQEEVTKIQYIFQLIFACSTATLFFYSTWQQYKNHERFYSNKILIALLITGFIVTRIGQLIIKYLAIDQEFVLDYLKRSLKLYFLYTQQINNITNFTPILIFCQANHDKIILNLYVQ